MAFAATPKNACGISSGFDTVTLVPTPGNQTLTRSRSFGALERCAPRAGPHQPAEELVAPIVDEEQRDEFLGGASLGAEIEPFPRLEVVLGEDEGVLDAPSLLAESPRRPPSHRTLPSGIVMFQATRSLRAVPSPPVLDTRVQVSIVGEPG